MPECLPSQCADFKALQVPTASQHWLWTDKILSGNKLSHYESGIFVNLLTEPESQREELGIAWSPRSLKTIMGVFLSPWWCAAVFFLEQLTRVFLVTAGEDGYLGELSTQLENLNIQRVLSFPWSCFPHPLLFYFSRKVQKWMVLLSGALQLTG